LNVYGIASRESGDVDEWRPSREEAEATLAQVLEEAPEVADDLYIAAVELPVSPNY
jgi:hypothetical protein